MCNHDVMQSGRPSTRDDLSLRLSYATSCDVANKGFKEYSFSRKTHLRSTERHLSYSVTCHLTLQANAPRLNTHEALFTINMVETEAKCK